MEDCLKESCYVENYDDGDIEMNEEPVAIYSHQESKPKGLPETETGVLAFSTLPSRPALDNRSELSFTATNPMKYRKVKRNDISPLPINNCNNDTSHAATTEIDQLVSNAAERNKEEMERKDFFWYYFLNPNLRQYHVLFYFGGLVILILVLYLIFFIPPAPSSEIVFTLPAEIYIEDDYVIYPEFPFTIASTQDEPFDLVLFGDSLIEFPSEDNHLKQRIDTKVRAAIKDPVSGQSFNMRIIDSGMGGNKILDLRNRLNRDVLSRANQIDGIIVFWDSDVSDQDDNYLALQSTQATYSDNVEYVFTQLLTVTPFVAIAGPEILGEDLIGKKDMLDRYRSLNQQVARKLKIPYIDIRKGFVEIMPKYFQLNPPGFLTRDGEHPNAYGTDLIILVKW